MKYHKIIFFVGRQYVFIPLLLFALFLVNTVCNRISEQPEKNIPAVSIENLRNVYGKEFSRKAMYHRFALQAEKQKNREIASLYHALEKSEGFHLLNHIGMLKKFGIDLPKPKEEPVIVGTIYQTLKMALSMEEIEYSSIYPSLIHCAEVEKQYDCVKSLRFIQDADTKHGELLRYAIDRIKDMPHLKYAICPVCGYIKTTEEITECPVCANNTAKFEQL